MFVYLDHSFVSLTMVLHTSPFIPSLAPVALSRTINLVSGVAPNKMSKTKETYWYHCLIGASSRGYKVTYRVGMQSQVFLIRKNADCLHLSWFCCVQASSEATGQRMMMTTVVSPQPAQNWLMSQVGDLRTPHSWVNPWPPIMVDLPHAHVCMGGLFSYIFGGYKIMQKNLVTIPITRWAYHSSIYMC